jgi:hypothetical protein
MDSIHVSIRACNFVTISQIFAYGRHNNKKALKKYLPDGILYRKKMGFGGACGRVAAKRPQRL